MFANIGKIVTAIGAIRGLLSLIEPITNLVRQVEETGIGGAEKKAAVLDLVKKTVLTVESALSISLPDELILGFADNIIDVIVAVENLLGRFKHGEEAAPAASFPADG